MCLTVLLNGCWLFQIESLHSQHDYLEKQLDSLKAASSPNKDELRRLKELKKVISTEEKEIDRLVQGSKQLKEKVTGRISPLFFSCLIINTIENIILLSIV